PEPPMAPEPVEPAELSLLELPVPAAVLPRGWFGFSFQCAECFAHPASGDSAAVWEFKSLPTVYSVDLGSPAAKAGIRRGDVITGIDGYSILSSTAGRRFSLIQPGQVVRWMVLRDGAVRTLFARAGERPGRERNLADLRREITRLNQTSDLGEMRQRIRVLNRELERIRVQERPRARNATPARRLRYAGMVGATEVEVRGPSSVIVSEAADNEELVINVGETVIVVRKSDLLGKRRGEKP
ncbi:MAG: PDZ domain-containing protein, partial [Candidatus Eiseniibacteriota bacterium]